MVCLLNYIDGSTACSVCSPPRSCYPFLSSLLVSLKDHPCIIYVCYFSHCLTEKLDKSHLKKTVENTHINRKTESS